MRQPRFIVIHHPASDNIAGSLKDHIHPPFTDAPYDWWVEWAEDPKDVRVVKGRSLAKRGAHVIPDYPQWKQVNNDTAIGVAFEGNFDNDTPPIGPSEAQLEIGAALVGSLCAEYGIHPLNVLPHQLVSKTVCPGKHFMATWKIFIGKVFWYRAQTLKEDARAPVDSPAH